MAENVRALTMKQYNQLFENSVATAIYNAACNEFDATRECKYNRLRSCSAYVYETENYYILRSYDTLVAVIQKQSNICVDVLRYVYGYSATSAQHISKFFHDYTPYPWNNNKYTFRHI